METFYRLTGLTSVEQDKKLHFYTGNRHRLLARYH